MHRDPAGVTSPLPGLRTHFSTPWSSVTGRAWWGGGGEVGGTEVDVPGLPSVLRSESIAAPAQQQHAGCANRLHMNKHKRQDAWEVSAWQCRAWTGSGALDLHMRTGSDSPCPSGDGWPPGHRPGSRPTAPAAGQPIWNRPGIYTRRRQGPGMLPQGNCASEGLPRAVTWRAGAAVGAACNKRVLALHTHKVGSCRQAGPAVQKGFYEGTTGQRHVNACRRQGRLSRAVERAPPRPGAPPWAGPVLRAPLPWSPAPSLGPRV